MLSSAKQDWEFEYVFKGTVEKGPISSGAFIVIEDSLMKYSFKKSLSLL